MIISERVRERMEARGISQSELARRVNVTQGAIAKIVGNNPGGSSHLHKIARELGTTPAYLTGETDDPAAGALPITQRDVAEHLDLVSIESVDLAYGMGGTFTDVPIETTVMHFPRSWVAAITSTPPSQLTFARGRGDSMVPTLQDGDMVLIDRSQKSVREQDAIWALTLGDIGMIKRVRVRGPAISLLSDNDRVPPDEVSIEEINIVGRVVFIGRRT